MMNIFLNLFSLLVSPLGLVAVLAGSMSMTVVVSVALWPRNFWPLFVIFTVGTGGIVIQSMGILDEYLVASMLLGAFAAMAIGAVRMRNGAANKFHLTIFLLMVMYMILQSVYGIVVLENLRNLRWVASYIVVGIIAVLLSTQAFPMLSKRALCFIIAKTSIVYFLFYIVVGFLYALFTGGEKWGIQNLIWGGTTYAAFPLLASMPAILFLMKDNTARYRKIAWVALIVVALASFYYESRSSWLVMLGFFIVAFPTLGLKKSFLYAIIFFTTLVTFVGFLWPSYYTFQAFGKVLFEGSEMFWKPSEAHDIERLMHIRAAFLVTSSDWKTFFIGHGFRTSGPYIGPALERLYFEAGRPDLAASSATYQSTVGFTSLFIETGIIGILLLFSNFLFVAKQILYRRNMQGRAILLFALLMSFLWLFITNPTDILLFYFIIMPSGLLIQLTYAPQPEQIQNHDVA